MDSTKPSPSEEEDRRNSNIAAIRVFIGFLVMLGIVALLAMISYVGALVHFHFFPRPFRQ